MIVLSFSTLSLMNSKVKIGFEYGIIIIKFPERSLFRRLDKKVLKQPVNTGEEAFEACDRPVSMSALKN